MKDLDRSGDDSIDFDEFLLIVSKKDHFKYMAEDIIKAFKLFDTKSKGRLSIQQLSDILKNSTDKRGNDDLPSLL